MERTKPVTLGIAGGSGSGKTTVATALIDQVGADHIAVIAHDSYYKDLSHLPDTQRTQVNFDHPDSLDTSLMTEHIHRLQMGQTIAVPVYDFTIHERTAQTRTVQPRPIILVEGILILAEASLRSLCDIKIFVDIDPDVRFIRRLERDTQERGRSVESVVQQYLQTVRPMHLQFVEPSKRYADVIIPEGGYNTVAIEMVAERIRRVLAEWD
ncbi:MAG: uridine kinase [Anaerolineaceae bacterium]|nr:uridine kinase [Anaerolineaceae bacterium]MCY3936088.1 uridine kinase [Chloroflexota bacterium]MCY4008184.1 uridine kinase [Anaerolineaceae bacterium]MCY4105439.1 uridine kinase [Chloroflexota bacterium]